MTPTARKLVDVLKKSCRLTTQKDFEAFADAVTQLRRRKSADVLRELLRCFRDVEAGEVQYELVEACEEYPSQMYLPVFVEEGPAFHRRSPEWFSLMFQSFLNSALDKQSFLHLLELRPLDDVRYFLSIVKQLDDKRYQNVCKSIDRLVNAEPTGRKRPPRLRSG